MDPMRVVIVDDHGVVREGLARLLAEAGLAVVGEAATGREGLRLVRALRPEVAVVDAALPELPGLLLCHRVRQRYPGTAVVILSVFDNPEWRAEAARAGAAAFVSKGDSPATLAEAVRRAGQGEVLLPPLPPDAGALTAREREVVQLVAEGKKTVEIAALLCRSVATVRAHKASAMRKLGVHTTPELVRRALDLGLVPAPVPGGRRGSR